MKKKIEGKTYKEEKLYKFMVENREMVRRESWNVVKDLKGMFVVSRGGPGALIVSGKSKISCAFSNSIWLPVILPRDTRMYVLLHIYKHPNDDDAFSFSFTCWQIDKNYKPPPQIRKITQRPTPRIFSKSSSRKKKFFNLFLFLLLQMILFFLSQ